MAGIAERQVARFTLPPRRTCEWRNANPIYIHETVARQAHCCSSILWNEDYTAHVNQGFDVISVGLAFVIDLGRRMFVAC
jgi:hypothetical protein